MPDKVGVRPATTGSGVDLELSTSPDGTYSFQSPDRDVRLYIEFQAVSPVSRGPIVERIRRLVWKQLRDDWADSVTEAELRITVYEYELGSRVARYFTYGAAGNVKVSLGVVGTVNETLVDDAFVVARHLGLYGGSSQQMIDASLNECISGVLTTIRRAAGVPETGFSSYWKTLHVAKWAAAATMLAVYLAFTLINLQPAAKRNFEIRDPEFRRNVLVFGGVLAALGTYAMFAMSILLLAPRRFLETDPRGIRAMSRLGSRSLSGMRIGAVLLAGVGAALVWTAVYIYRNP